MTKRAPWTDQENAALVALYFAMLDAQRHLDEYGMTYNKAGMIRHARGEAVGAGMTTVEHGALANRSRGSIEAKLMNASAAHRDLSAESGGQATTMDGYGYRCLSNYQAALKDAMRAALLSREFRGAEELLA